MTCIVDVISEVLSSQQCTIHVSERPLKIIDNPATTLKHGYVNQTFVDHWANEIATEEVTAGSKTNPLYATLAGKGKGKTRFFVELEKNLNQRDNVFALAITFNNLWTTILKFDDNNPTMSMAVEVVLRMLTMAYGVDNFDYLRQEFTASLRRLLSHDRKVNGTMLLRDCVEYIVEDVRRSKPGCKRFVLLVDEPMYLVEKGRMDVNVFDSLRSALLDMPILDFSTSLVMSALNVDVVFGATNSGRFIKTIPLAVQLDINETYHTWLPDHLPQLNTTDSKDETTELALMLLLTLTTSIPRATEILVSRLVAVFSSDQPLSFNATIIYNILGSVLHKLEERYRSTDGADIMLTDSRMAYHLLWNETMKWNEDVNSAMIDSFVINPPDTITVGIKHTPLVSALSLSRLQPNMRTMSSDYFAPLWPLVNATASIVRSASTYNSTEKVGKPLEMMGNAIITSKLLSAHQFPEKERKRMVSSFTLFNIEAEETSVDEEQVKSVRFKMNGAVEFLKELFYDKPLSNSHDDLQSHIDDLLKRTIETGDVRIFKVHEKESWDGMWMVRQDDRKKTEPFVLFVDYKFREIPVAKDAINATEAGDGKDATMIRTPKPDNHQAEYVRDRIVPACQAASKRKNKQHAKSAAAAIADGRFLYVYIDTRRSDDGKDVSLVFPGDQRFLRLTGEAARRAVTNLGTQVLDVVRLASTLQETMKRQRPTQPRE